MKRECSKCGGSGKVIDSEYASQLDQRDLKYAQKDKCKKCNGTGKTKEKT